MTTAPGPAAALAATPAGGPVRRRVGWLAALVVVPWVLLGLAWAVADPPGAGPDETDHLTRAISVSRLDLGVPVPVTASGTIQARNQSNGRTVTIPRRLDPAGLLCAKFRPAVDASCQPPTPAVPPVGDTTVVTTMGSFPPFLYPGLGLVARTASSAPEAVLRVRLAILVAATLLLWLAARHLLAWSARSGVVVGMVVGVTPFVSFCTGTVTTSAFEICGAFGVAAVAVVATRRPDSLVRPATLATLAVSGSALVLSRQLGIVTFAVLAVWALARGAWRPLLESVRRRSRGVLTVLGLLLVEGVAVAWWELTQDHEAGVGPWVTLPGLEAFRTQLPVIAQQAVGWFGWLDVRPPWPYAALWGLLVLALVGGALVVGTVRDRLDLLAFVGLTLVLAAVSYVRLFYPIGAGLQGRHVLPFFAVVPVLAGVVVSERVAPRTLRHVAVPGALVAAAVFVWGFWLNAQRYAVGLPHRVWFLPDARWSPPLGWAPWLLLAVVGALGLVAVVSRITATPTPRRPRRRHP